MHTTLVPMVISHGRSWLDPTVHGHSIGHPVSSTGPESPSSFVACLHEDFAAAPVCVSLYLVSFLLPLGLPRLPLSLIPTLLSIPMQYSSRLKMGVLPFNVF